VGRTASFVRRRIARIAPTATAGVRPPPQLAASVFLLTVERLFSGYVRHVAYRRGNAVTSKAEEYRAKARECEERAAQMPDSYLKEQMLEVAKKWRNMAAYEEKYGR
jgi:hypothetical protein